MCYRATNYCVHKVNVYTWALTLSEWGIRPTSLSELTLSDKIARDKSVTYTVLYHGDHVINQLRIQLYIMVNCYCLCGQGSFTI